MNKAHQKQNQETVSDNIVLLEAYFRPEVFSIMSKT